MTPPSRNPQANRAHTASLAKRWRDLADQRLQHFVELYQSGRWRRYYGEAEFLRQVRELVAAVETWDKLTPADPHAPPRASASSVAANEISLAPLMRGESGTMASEPVAPVVPALPGDTSEASPESLAHRLPPVSPLA